MEKLKPGDVIFLDTLSIENEKKSQLIRDQNQRTRELTKFLLMVDECLNEGIPIEKDDPIHNVAKQLLNQKQ